MLASFYVSPSTQYVQFYTTDGQPWNVIGYPQMGDYGQMGFNYSNGGRTDYVEITAIPHSNLVTNGGFETNDFSGWTTVAASYGSAFGVYPSAGSHRPPLRQPLCWLWLLGTHRRYRFSAVAGNHSGRVVYVHFLVSARQHGQRQRLYRELEQVRRSLRCRTPTCSVGRNTRLLKRPLPLRLPSSSAEAIAGDPATTTWTTLV